MSGQSGTEGESDAASDYVNEIDKYDHISDKYVVPFFFLLAVSIYECAETVH